MSEIYKIVMVALSAAFTILVFTKTGLRDKLRDAFDVKCIAFMAKMIDCDLCISGAILTGDITLLVIPIFSTPITRFLL